MLRKSTFGKTLQMMVLFFKMRILYRHVVCNQIYQLQLKSVSYCGFYGHLRFRQLFDVARHSGTEQHHLLLLGTILQETVDLLLKAMTEHTC